MMSPMENRRLMARRKIAMAIRLMGEARTELTEGEFVAFVKANNKELGGAGFIGALGDLLGRVAITDLPPTDRKERA